MQGFDNYIGSAEKNITLTACVWPKVAFDDDGEFKEACGADQAAVSVVDELGVEGGFRLPKENGGQRRGVSRYWGGRVRYKEFGVISIRTLDRVEARWAMARSSSTEALLRRAGGVRTVPQASLTAPVMVSPVTLAMA